MDSCNIYDFLQIIECADIPFTDSTLPNIPYKEHYRIYFTNNFLVCPNFQKYGDMSVSVLGNPYFDCNCITRNREQDIFPCSTKPDLHANSINIALVIGLVFLSLFVLLIVLIGVFLWWKKIQRRGTRRLLGKGNI